MNSATLIICIVLYGPALLCFYIPFICGQIETGKIVGIILGGIITLTIVAIDFFVFFIPIILLFEIIFITYWILRKFGKAKAGKWIALFLTFFFLLFIMQPWISDWTFSKKDVKKVLSYHNIKMNDDFKILINESGGIRDYYETFTIKMSDADYNTLSDKIKTSKDFKRFTDYLKVPSPEYGNYDTVNYETKYLLNREYFSTKTLNNSTFHFIFQLDKQKKELNYIGSNE